MDSLARFFFLIILAERTIGTEIVNSPSLTLTNVTIGNYTVLCVAKGRPAPKLMIVHHLSETSFNVTANFTTPPSGKEEQFTSRIEYLYRCTSASSNRLVKCCDVRKLWCTDRTLPSCQDYTETNTTMLPHTPQDSTGGDTFDDTSSTSTTLLVTTRLTKDHTSLADHGETKQWLVPVISVVTIVGAVIIMVAIAFFISLTLSRASNQQGPLVNGNPQLGNHAERVERYEMNANEEDGPHDTAVYANVPAEVTNASNTQSPLSTSLALDPDTACNALGPDGMGLYSETRSVVWDEEMTIPGEEKELTYIDLDFGENKQTPGPSYSRYQPVEYVMVDFTQTNTLRG